MNDFEILYHIHLLGITAVMKRRDIALLGSREMWISSDLSARKSRNWILPWAENMPWVENQAENVLENIVQN